MSDRMMTAASIGASKAGGYARYLESKTVAPEIGDYYLTASLEPAQDPGRWLASAETIARLGIDGEMVRHIHAQDEAGFRREFAAALKLVRQRGTPVPHERLVGSDVVLPAADTTLAEARHLLLHDEA